MKRSDLSTPAVLRAVRDHGTSAYEHLAAHYPHKIIRAAFARDRRSRLIECGVTVDRPWLTEAGRSALAGTAEAEPRAADYPSHQTYEQAWYAWRARARDERMTDAERAAQFEVIEAAIRARPR
ncbi:MULTISPECIES: hypothetical protein [unclassified Streptomyces]|uniref:hypothetical protein n=1 Tax=unclassified Streptomyces TaxID=2593676 RepID=UPI0036E68C58